MDYEMLRTYQMFLTLKRYTKRFLGYAWETMLLKCHGSHEMSLFGCISN